MNEAGSFDDGNAPTASLTSLRRRSELLTRIREFFVSQGYWEVETPLLCHESVIDAHLDPFVVEVPVAGNASRKPMFLQTSPEFCMKRLLVHGAERIFQISKAFRRDEAGRSHNPEFTLLEWYAVGEDKFEQMDFIEQLCREVMARSAYEPVLPSEFVRIAYEDAFRHSCGISALETSVEELIRTCKEMVSRDIPERHQGVDEGKDFWLDLLLTGCVEPWLKQQRAVFLYDYPISQAALARLSPEDPRVAERFELYLDGLEICNGYRELLDASELERRNQEQNRIRLAHGASQLPEPARLLSAMRKGLPDCSGVALGIDRLMMLALGAESLEEVIAFPFSRA